MSVRTLRRWQQWRQEAFPVTTLWKSLRGRMTPRNSSSLWLPAALLEHCSGETEQKRLVELLRLLAPRAAAARCSREVA